MSSLLHRRSRRRAPLLSSRDADPLEGMANFFDIGIVFALGFMLASLLAMRAELPERQIDADEQVVVRHLSESGRQGEGQGVRLGTAYRLKSGEIVYVPDRSAKDD